MLNGDNKYAVPFSCVMVLHLEGKIAQKYIQSYCVGFFFS